MTQLLSVAEREVLTRGRGWWSRRAELLSGGAYSSEAEAWT